MVQAAETTNRVTNVVVSDIMRKNKHAVCGHPGDYKSRVILWMPYHWMTAKEQRYFDVDACIASEVNRLINRYCIRTIESCCGHGIEDGYICVEEAAVDTMLRLGYEHLSGLPKEFFKIRATNIKHIGPSPKQKGVTMSEHPIRRPKPKKKKKKL